MNAEDHREVREMLGAFVLDQLGETDRTLVRDHLAGCAECRAEVESLRPVATALGSLDHSLVGSPVPPAELGDQVLRAVDSRRRAAARRSRLRRAGGAVLVAASVGVAFAVGSWYNGPRNDPPVIAVALQVDLPGIAANAGLVKHTWGTELKLQATGLTDGGSYTVTFVRDDGSRVGAGSFLGTGSRPVRCSVNAALPIDRATALMVTDQAGTLVMDASL
ncbi:MAG TPA: zf-HC2 domain-containing protein [Propionibacteriaceae bacterium]